MRSSYLATPALWLILFACSNEPTDPGGAGGEGGEKNNPTGGSASGGAASSGGASGGSGGSGGEASPPSIQVDFDSDEGFAIVPKTALIPGATGTRVEDAHAEDNAALRLFIPGDPALGSGDYVGPGAHAIEASIDGSRQLYGRYEMRVRFPICASDEELVTGLFTYFNDGSDADANGIADNSEIDIEHLCGDPEYLWFSVWTDYQGAPVETFRRTTRVVNMRTGSALETPKGHDRYGDLSPAPAVDVALADFPNPDAYYQLGFEWRADFVRYYLVHEGREIELWRLEGAAYVPQREAIFLLNLWHPAEHWWSGGAADFPSNDAALHVDWVKLWP